MFESLNFYSFLNKCTVDKQSVFKENRSLSTVYINYIAKCGISGVSNFRIVN